MPLYIPGSVSCPPVDNPLQSALTSSPVPYAAALQRVRCDHPDVLRAIASAESGLCRNNSGETAEEFAWLDQGNNSAARISSRVAEQAKQATTTNYFMYFRVRVPGYRSVLNSVQQTAKSESLFREEKLNKWTISYRFRLRKGAPIRLALRAFTCRLGLENDPSVTFCRDGFYGDASAGTLTNPTGIPHQMLLGDVTAQGCGLSNGSSIFVSQTTPHEREAAATVLRMIDDDTPEGEEGREKGGGAATSPVVAADGVGDDGASEKPASTSALPEDSECPLVF